MSSAIVVRDLRKSYGGVEALSGIDFEVARGEVFGLLGPNGAGKTTTVEILEGYRRRDGGTAEVLGFDPATGGRAYREQIGVVLQQSELTPVLTVRETHQLFAGYYERPRDVDEVIELVGLEREARRAREDAFRRPEAPARSRHRARRRPGPRLPRRADDRLRPGRAPLRLGDDPLAARARQDSSPHDALPRRGAAARRPRRGPARRRDRPHRRAGGADRRGGGGRDPLPRERPRGGARDGRADARAARADRGRAGRRARARRAGSAPADPRGRLPRARRRGGPG